MTPPPPPGGELPSNSLRRPADTPATRLLARAQSTARAGRHEEAIALLAPLLADPQADQGVTHYLLAESHLALGRHAEARATDAGGRTDPTQAALAQRSFEQALTHARACLAHAPSSPSAHLLLGFVLRGAGRTQEALTPLAEAARLDPGDPDNHRHLAKALADAGQHQQAREEAMLLARLAPQDPDSHFTVGYVCHEADAATARRAYLETLRLEPTHSAARYNLAVLDHDAAPAAAQAAALTDAMRDVLRGSPQAAGPVFALDQLVSTALSQAWYIVLTGFVLTARLVQDGPVLALVACLAAGVVAAVVALRGVRPLRSSLPGWRSVLRGLARRRRWEVVAGVATVLTWVTCLLGCVCALAGVGPREGSWVLLAVVPGAVAQGARLYGDRWARRRQAWVHRNGLR